MGMRVRKAAKVLGCSPEEVIGLLLALGITRYKTTQDQLSDRILVQLQEAVRAGIKPIETVVKESGKKSGEPAPLKVDADVMVNLMGAEDGGSQGARPAPAVPETVTNVRVETGYAAQNVEVQLQALAQERALLERERLALQAQQVEHEAQVKQHLQDKLASAVTQATTALDTQEPAQLTEGVGLDVLLRERGLTTFDQWDAALTSLGNARLLAPLVEGLRVSESERFKKLLTDKVLLVEGEEPSLVPPGIVTVQVPIGNGEVPGRELLNQGLSALSEGFLLHGMRRVVVCGGTHIGRWYLKQAMDDRIKLDLLERLDGVTISADVVVLWGRDITANERTQIEKSSATVVEVESSSLEDLFAVSTAFFH